MPKELLETLKDVKRSPGFSAPEMVDRYPGIGTTAVNNRLEELRRLGLVRRERDGKSFRYFPI